MDVAGFCRSANESERSALITAVESLFNDSNPLLNGLIFDVLQRLGALEQEQQEHSQGIRVHVDQLLAGPDDKEKCAEAYTVYLCQFDHPYSPAYYHVVNDLPEEQRKELLIMAAKGAPDDTQLFTSLLIMEVAAFNDASVGKIISRWTAPPAVDSFAPQEAVEAFVLAHIALARLGCELPKCRAVTDSAATDALLACGDILYWSNRMDLSDDERRAACLQAWTILNRHDKGAALSAIKDCACISLRFGNELPGTDPVYTSIAYYCPSETAVVCREALERPSIQIGYFRHFSHRDKNEVLGFAVDALGKLGSAIDFILLRRLSDDPHVGQRAIRAVQKIEQRLSL